MQEYVDVYFEKVNNFICENFKTITLLFQKVHTHESLFKAMEELNELLQAQDFCVRLNKYFVMDNNQPHQTFRGNRKYDDFKDRERYVYSLDLSRTVDIVYQQKVDFTPIEFIHLLVCRENDYQIKAYCFLDLLDVDMEEYEVGRPEESSYESFMNGTHTYCSLPSPNVWFIGDQLGLEGIDFK